MCVCVCVCVRARARVGMEDLPLSNLWLCSINDELLINTF